MLGPTNTTVGIIDDHQLFVHSLGLLVNSFGGFETIIEAHSGEYLLKGLANLPAVPDILLVDINMPGIDGVHIAEAVTKQYPLVRLIALSMNDDDLSIISMLQAGCCAYLLKGIAPIELERALSEVRDTGFYNGDSWNINCRRLAQQHSRRDDSRLSDKELRFLQLACSEWTYKEIAGRMNLSERTIDGYRESIFEKLKVQSRVGMVLEGIRLKLIRMER